MKKLISIILFLFCLSVYPQHYNDYTEKFGMTGQIGYYHTGYSNDNKGQLSVGASITVYNVYADISLGISRYSNSYKVDVWSNQHKHIALHAGYRINAYKYFGITPIIGYFQFDTGTVNGYNWNCIGGNIHNEFTAKDKYKDLDYGIVLDYHFPIVAKSLYFKLSSTITKHGATLGIGMSM